MPVDVFSNRFQVEYDPEKECLNIWILKGHSKKLGPIEITRQGLGTLSFANAAEFVGEKILLIPAMREQFKDYLWSDDGTTPPKKA